MSENSKIEWTDHTFNPWEGCQKVGPGCDHCYAETRNARYGGGVAVNWGPGAPRRRTSEANWRKPLAWNRNADAFYAEHGRRQRVFCASLADVFDNAVPIEWLRDLCSLIELTPELDWLLLTKRVGNVFERLIEARSHDWLAGRRNVWLGIPDYLVTMRSPGESERITHTNDEFPVDLWQRIASPVWMDINPSDTLQHRSAREHDDERHIAPLQLEVIRRGILLWSNPDDVVLSPFLGIGSEGYVALEMGRKFIGVELKKSYFDQAVKNLAAATMHQAADMFADADHAA